MPINFSAPYTPVHARDPASKPILLQGALEGHVLVKNTNNALPLKSPKMLSIFGYDATVPPAVNGPENSFSFGGEPQLAALSFSNAPTPQMALNGTMISGGKQNSTLFKDVQLDWCIDVNYRW
jgi:beta-glucosidase